MEARTAIVTGASQGLGLALARLLGRAGWQLVVDARSPGPLRSAAESIRATSGLPVVAVPGDVADPAHAAKLVAAATVLGDVRLVVNNASTLGPSPLPRLAEFPLDALGDIYQVNVVAPLRLIQLALPQLRANRGTVLNVTSDAAVEGYEGWGGYGAAKAALEQASRVLAAEEPEVRVLWVDPGDMNTQMHQQAFPGEDISDRPEPEERAPALLALIEGAQPSGRYQAGDLLVERSVA